MISKWFRQKNRVIEIRKTGASYEDLKRSFGIPKSTLNSWLKNVKLTQKQRGALDKRWRIALIAARKKAVKWHNDQKAIRLKQAEVEAGSLIEKIDLKDDSILDLALAMLYLGEGSKTNGATGMGNSDPMILRFFISALERIYKIQRSKLYCELHLRADQKPLALKRYWSKELDIPIENFRSVSIDQRTAGSKTYPHYKGVCIVRAGSIAIQRKLMYTSKIFCEKICARSSAG